VLDLLDFVQVLGQALACVLCVNPTRCFFNNFADRSVLDNFSDIDRVVHRLKNPVLERISHFNKLEELQPEVLQLVGVVFEQVKIVADSRQNLIEVFLLLALIFLNLISGCLGCLLGLLTLPWVL
jgi:hypothetical protein